MPHPGDPLLPSQHACDARDHIRAAEKEHGAIEPPLSFDGRSALGAAICRLGIPRVKLLSHKIEIMAGQCAVIVLGSPESVSKAKTALAAIHGVIECDDAAPDVTEKEER